MVISIMLMYNYAFALGYALKMIHIRQMVQVQGGIKYFNTLQSLERNQLKRTQNNWNTLEATLENCWKCTFSFVRYFLSIMLNFNSRFNSLKTVYRLVVEFTADCLTRDLGQWMGCPPWGSF